jgi:hypothetical protein
MSDDIKPYESDAEVDADMIDGLNRVIDRQDAKIESDAKVIAVLMETLEQYACHGLEKCPVQKLKDGSCVHTGTGHCGDAAFRAIEQTAGK